MTLAELNACERDRFMEALGWVFEGSPWVAERAYGRRPFARVEDLHAAMTDAAAAASPDEQLALLCAHPDLGAKAKLSDASTGEQSGAGLDRLSPTEFEALQRVNGEYRAKFGFPFLLAVRGSTKHDIFASLEARLPSTVEVERAEALRQVYRIAEFRLRDIVQD